ncbi:MAG: hypothetical protein AAFY60_09950, partial [Myxococcota bacterium]
VIGSELDSTDPRSVLVYTNFQVPGQSYTLRVFGLTSTGGQETPDAGLSSLFTGYVEPAVPRSLLLFVPSSVRQDDPFEVSVLARNNDDLSTYADMSSELLWTLSSDGTIEVADSTGWNEGSQTFTLIARSTPPIPDGETRTVTLSAAAVDDSALDGTSRVFELGGAVALERFEVLGPSVAEVGEDFLLTIRALGSDGALFESYEGTVALAPNSGIGELNTTVSPPFAAGEVSFATRYDVLTPTLELVATDALDPTRTGRSASIEVGLSDAGTTAPTLTAISTDLDEIRLDWTLVPGATRYAIEVSENGSDFEDVITLVSGLYTFSHPDRTTGALYRYRLTAWDGDTLLATLEAESEAESWTLIDAETISAPLVLTANQSPYLLQNPSGGRVTVSTSLTIEAGVVVLFPEGGGLDLSGPGAALSVDGTRSSPVHLTAREASRPWSGVRLQSNIQGTTYAPGSLDYFAGSRISHLVLDYGSAGDYALEVQVPLDMNGMVLRHNRGLSGSLGVLLPTDQQLTLRRSRFVQNKPAIFIIDAGSELVMDTNAWSFNESQTAGGGAWRVNSPSLAVVREQGSVYYLNQSAQDAGAAFAAGVPQVFIEDSTFIQNRSETRGGALLTQSEAT